MNKSPEHFELNEKTQLYLPKGVDASRPWTSDISHQEVLGQREVFGVDGHGSIRNETILNGTTVEDEKADNSIKDMLDPKNIIDLKEKLETKALKLADESSYSFDKRLDKDGVLAKGKKDLRSSLKASLIDEYTQTGADKESPREIPESVMNDISRMLDLSYDELESRIVENDKPEQVKLTQSENSSEVSTQDSENWTNFKPDINTRVRNQADFDFASNQMGQAIQNGDSEQFEKAYKFLQNEVIADRLITGEKHEKFEDEMSRLRALLESKKADKKPDSSVVLPPPVSINKNVDADKAGSKNKVIPIPLNIKTNDEEHVAVILPDNYTSEEPIVENNSRRNKFVKAALGIAAVAGVFGFGAWLAERNNDSASEVPQPEPTEVTENAPVTTAVTDETSPENSEADAQTEELAALEQSIKDRTVEVSDTQGATSWDKATALYGDQASIRLIQAAEAVAADGIEVSWSADPYTSKTAQLSINGTTDPSVVWQFLSPRLAKQDANNFLANAEVGEPALPETE